MPPWEKDISGLLATKEFGYNYWDNCCLEHSKAISHSGTYNSIYQLGKYFVLCSGLES